MANILRRLPENVSGDFFVDDTCIDCDTCRQMAPATFRDHGNQSSVYAQPRTPGERLRALKALVACPTASIGTETKTPEVRVAIASFPERISEDETDNVFYCGFTSEKSFGGWSYFIARPPEQGGNLLVDSPRFSIPLARRIHEMGGIRRMFLTHADDVADHARFAQEFGCERIMHTADGAARRGVERIIADSAPVSLDESLLAIPTPGHTRGHMALLYRNRYLFTGDHLAWSPERQTLIAFHDVCWYSWTEQTGSMEKLLPYRFEWVLPGHGRIGHAGADEMHRHLEKCVRWMRGRQ